MASIIKNQIIKHISKFTKNLSQDKIGLSTLKGEGTLTNLELDEEVLMEVLELPSWIVITKAVCNRVNVKIPWTKLKTHPMCIYLDEVVVEMRTCRELRSPNTPTGKAQQASSGPSKYGYVEKVIDGMYVHVNNISGTFLSDTFRGDIQISQLLLQSTTPDWKPANLRATRLNLQEEGDVITFKQVEWSTVRIIVDAIDTKITGTGSTPIRLITNQGHVRIAIKKRISDCGLVASKLQVLLDDILLVLTDSQLKAVILHFRSLSPVIQKATAQSKARAAEKGQAGGSSKSAQDITNRTNQANRTDTEYQYLQIVKKHDVVETSYHFLTKHVDLHLCDELNRKDTDTPGKRIEGGSMQVSMTGLSLDYYPYHSAGSTRTHWNFFDESFQTSDTWIHSLLAHFKQQYSAARREIDKLQKEVQTAPANVSLNRGSPSHVKPVSSKPVNTSSSSKSKTAEVKGHQQSSKSPPMTTTQQQSLAINQRKQVKLMSHCMIIRVQGYKFSSVATAAKMPRNDQEEVHCLLQSDKKTFCLPDDVPSIHVEYTSFYFPNELDFPVPSPIMFIQCNPLVFYLDFMTVLWLNQFCFNILQTLPDLEEFAAAADDEGEDHTDIRLDALMPKIIIPSEPEHIRPDQPDRPQELQIQVSKLTATNCRIGTNLNRPFLSKLLQSLNRHKLVTDKSTFPGATADILLTPQVFWTHAFEQNFYTPEVITAYKEGKAVGNGAIPNSSQVQGSAAALQMPKLQTNSFRKDACNDVWGVEVDQIWAEFTGVPSSPDRPVPFVEPMPIHVWVSFPPKTPSDDPKASQVSLQGQDQTGKSSDKEELADLHALLELASPVHVILNHYQFLFLMRLQNSLKELSTDLEKDQLLFSEKAPVITSQVIAVDCPSVQVSLLLPEEPSPEPEETSERESPTSGVEEVLGDTTLVPDNKEEDEGLVPPDKFSEEHRSRGSLNSQGPEEKVTDSDRLELNGNVEKGLKNEVENDELSATSRGLPPPGVFVVPEDIPISRNDLDVSDSELHRSLSEASNLSSKDLSRSRRSTSPSLGRPSLQIQEGRKGGASSVEDLSRGISESRSSLNSLTGSVQLSTLLMKSNSSVSLDELVSKEDLDLLSVDSDSSDGFSFVNRKDDQRGGSMQDVGSESGFGSEFSHSTTTVGQQDQKTQNGFNEEVKEEESGAVDQETDFSDNPYKLKKISLVRGRLHDLCAGVLMVGKDLSVKAEVQAVSKKEEGNTEFNTFMGKFDSGDVKGTIEDPPPPVPSAGPAILLRFDSGPSAEELCETAQERGYVQLKARNIDVDVLQTTITHVSGIVQDEIKSLPMPISIWVQESNFKLIDNVPPAYPTNADGTDPLPLKIPSLRVFRSPDGVFHLEGIGNPGQPGNQESSSLPSIQQTDTERENNQLKQRMTMMEEAMEVLEHERISLMSTLEHLQEELLTSDRQKDDLLYKFNELRRKVELGK
ncbi:bridge-like lipid transfer protein family member 3B isoform X2 [Apostichopus japonicus]|uniref:bridge-like lipid transfer protein family member 3B isoform X2 n=1 Tax=Stichopus japonicus TaxID=307972 RepID=UPI003AB300A8